MRQYIRATFTRGAEDTPRVKYLDLAKGICIIYVVVLHCGHSIPLCNEFFLSLFFLLSGMFFSTTDTFGHFLKKKTRRLLLPLLYFSIISAVYFTVEKLVFEADYELEPSIGLWTHYIVRFPLWFLLALYFDYVILRVVKALFASELCVAAAVMAISAVGLILYNRGEDTANYFTIGCSLLSLPFFYLGYVFRRFSLMPIIERQSLWVGLSLLVGCYLYITYVDYSVLEYMTFSIKGNALMAYLLSLVASIGVLIVCNHIGWLPLVSLMGEVSLTVLCVHMIFLNMSAHIAQKMTTNILVVEVAVMVGALALSWLSAYYIKKYKII